MEGERHVHVSFSESEWVVRMGHNAYEFRIVYDGCEIKIDRKDSWCLEPVLEQIAHSLCLKSLDDTHRVNSGRTVHMMLTSKEGHPAVFHETVPMTCCIHESDIVKRTTHYMDLVDRFKRFMMMCAHVTVTPKQLGTTHSVSMGALAL